MADGEIKTIEPAEVVTGDVTAYTDTKSVTVDGTKYEYSKNYADATTADKVTYTLGNEYTLVLDNNGYVLYTDGTAGHNDYVYVAEMQPSGGAKSNLEGDAYFIDGTNEVIVIDNDDDFMTGDTVNTNVQGWYAYDKKSNGKYELSKVTKEDTYDGTVTSGNVTENGKSTVYVNDTDPVKPSVRANNNTIFVVNEDDDVAVYTGIKNVPDIKYVSGNDITVAVVMDGSYADVVYISAKDMSISGQSGDRVYILDSSYDASVDSDDNRYYEYDAIVNGEVGTIKATSRNLTEGLYQDVSYDSNGYMDDQKLVDNTDNTDEDFVKYTEVTKITYSAGVLTFKTDKDVVLADNYKIFVNDDGDGKTTTPSSLARDFNEAEYDSTVYVYLNDNEEAAEVYVWKDNSVDEGDEDVDVDTNVKSIDLSTAGVITVTVDNAPAEATEYTVSVAQLRDSGYVNVGDFTVEVAAYQTSGTLDISSSLVSGQTYQITYGDLKDTAAIG